MSSKAQVEPIIAPSDLGEPISSELTEERHFLKSRLERNLKSARFSWAISNILPFLLCKNALSKVCLGLGSKITLLGLEKDIGLG